MSIVVPVTNFLSTQNTDPPERFRHCIWQFVDGTYTLSFVDKKFLDRGNARGLEELTCCKLSVVVYPYTDTVNLLCFSK
jgi:hypothetical protein